MSCKLSILIPVYNESQTIRRLLDKILEIQQAKEIIVVDDGSTDETKNLLDTVYHPQIRVIRHLENRGKGAAVRTGISHCSGDIIVIQDADLDQDLNIIYQLVQPILTNSTPIVYGSRFLGKQRPKMKWANYWANQFLSFLTRFLYRSTLTDVETCFKSFKADLLKSLFLEGDGFEFEVEVTAKVLKRGYQIQEVPIHEEWYQENYHVGKKINWLDGVKAILTLLKYRFRS